MNILFILKRWDGGVGNVVKGYEKYLNRLGHKVYTLSCEDDLDAYTLRNSIRKIRKAVKKRKYDRIITNDWSLAIPLMFPFPIKFKSHYCIFHGEQSGFYSWIQRYVAFIMTTFNKLLVVGPKLARKFPRAKRVDNGVDLEIFKPLDNIKRDADHIGFANWKTDFYNYDKIVDAVGKVDRKLIVAEGLNRKTMANFYNSLNHFISLPDNAGYNLVWAEALACGVPKIIGNNEGIGEELPIYHIEGEITEEKIVEAINKAKFINSDERNKILNKIDINRAIKELIEALNINDGKEN